MKRLGHAALTAVVLAAGVAAFACFPGFGLAVSAALASLVLLIGLAIVIVMLMVPKSITIIDFFD